MSDIILVIIMISLIVVDIAQIKNRNKYMREMDKYAKELYKNTRTMKEIGSKIDLYITKYSTK
jgi:uncharacterized protein YxeA